MMCKEKYVNIIFSCSNKGRKNVNEPLLPIIKPIYSNLSKNFCQITEWMNIFWTLQCEHHLNNCILKETASRRVALKTSNNRKLIGLTTLILTIPY